MLIITKISDNIFSNLVIPITLLPCDFLRLSLDLQNFCRLSRRSDGLNGCEPSSSTVTNSGFLSFTPMIEQSLSGSSSIIIIIVE